jgi:mono/diheme cytochrome c family protein
MKLLAQAIACTILLSSIATAGAGEGPTFPAAIARMSRANRYAVALRNTRRIAIVDIDAGRVEREWRVDFEPVSLTTVGDRELLGVGGSDGEFALLNGEGIVVHRLKAGRGPIRAVGASSSYIVVAARWSEDAALVDCETGTIVRRIPLGFPPGAMTRSVDPADDRVWIADAFGSKIAQVHTSESIAPAEARVIVREFDFVNVGGMAPTPDGRELLIAHMHQYGQVSITSSNIDWGLVLSSKLSFVTLESFGGRSDEASRPVRVRRLTLDGSRHGAADPSAIAIGRDGKDVLIACRGAHRVLRVDRTSGAVSADASLLPVGDSQKIEEIEVGEGPIAIVLDRSGERAITVDSAADRLTVMGVRDGGVLKTIRLGPEKPVLTARDRGERLFHDGRLSLDRWMSCASCHVDGHTNGLNFDTLGDRAYSDAKNTPSLMGVSSTHPYAWTGRFDTIEEQIAHSIATTLRGRRDDDATVADLSAYVRGLSPPPARRSGGESLVERGRIAFESRRCATCHKPPLYTTDEVFNVGMIDFNGVDRFNPPSLRGVSRSAPYFHDGRAETLKDALRIHHPGRKRLDDVERVEIEAFLESL